VASALGSAGVAVTTFLPWYSVGGWHSLTPGTPVVSEFNALTLNWIGWQFGSEEWGFVLLGLACVMAALAATCAVALARGWRAPRSLVVVGLGATVLLVLALLEAYATPPFGDEPPLAYTWGAILGVVAAAVSVLGGWSAWLAERKAVRSLAV